MVCHLNWPPQPFFGKWATSCTYPFCLIASTYLFACPQTKSRQLDWQRVEISQVQLLSNKHQKNKQTNISHKPANKVFWLSRKRLKDPLVKDVILILILILILIHGTVYGFGHDHKTVKATRIQILFLEIIWCFVREGKGPVVSDTHPHIRTSGKAHVLPPCLVRSSKHSKRLRVDEVGKGKSRLGYHIIVRHQMQPSTATDRTRVHLNHPPLNRNGRRASKRTSHHTNFGKNSQKS